MKTLLSAILLMTLTTSTFAEGLGKIASQKAAKQALSLEIQKLSSLDAETLSLETLINKTKAGCELGINRAKKEGTSEKAISFLKADCQASINKMKEIGDVSTILDLQIFQLQELQTAANYLFYFSRETIDEMRFEFLNVGFLPLAIIADLVLLPFTFIASAATGF